MPSRHRVWTLIAAATAFTVGWTAIAEAQFWPYPYPAYRYGPAEGSVRLDVTPKDAEIYIDGYYAGVVDDFDGTFQRLRAEPGGHDITLYHPGFRSIVRRVYLTPNGTFKIREKMEPLGAGATAEPRPAPANPPEAGQPGAPFPPRGPATRRLPPPDRRPQDQPAQPGRANSGRLALHLQPRDAEVRIDGEVWSGAAQDPLLVDLSEGRHNIQIRKPGYVGFVTDVQIRRGEETNLDVSLKTQP